MIKTKLLLILFIVSLFMACNNSSSNETATSGEIAIAVDASFQPVLQSAIQVFEATYPKAKIKAFYVSESEAMDLLVKDSVRVAIVPRLYNEEETQYFENIKIKPRATQIAVEAIAFIVHKENPDTAIAYETIRQILSGKITTWKEIGKNPTRKDSITLVFDHPGSSIVSYVLDSINKNQPLPQNAFSASTNEKVIDYVSQNKSAMGLIPLAWIADMEDSTANKFLSKIEVVHIIGEDKEYRRPYLYYLKNGEYPFIRNVYALSREAKVGLGTGFVSFLAGKEGQRLIYKADLLPVNKPIRLVELQTRNLQ
ncbi:MAG: phosphate ABC transporter substrate-binding protein [Bacteroidia bacterium]|nr:MAG: phosphate ABC transporter substrate-binding protein [Bacteroidia bacterium]